MGCIMQKAVHQALTQSCILRLGFLGRMGTAPVWFSTFARIFRALIADSPNRLFSIYPLPHTQCAQLTCYRHAVNSHVTLSGVLLAVTRLLVVLLLSNLVSRVRRFIISSVITKTSAPVSTLKITVCPFTNRDSFHEVLPFSSLTASRKEALSNSIV